jgi:hypothetical protein
MEKASSLDLNDVIISQIYGVRVITIKSIRKI